MEAEGKAAGLLSFLEVLREMAPPDRMDAFARELPAETAALLETPPFPTAWLPQRHFMRMLATAQRVLFDGALEPLQELGRRQIGRDLSTVYKLLVRMVTTPHGMADRAARIWGTYVRNGGELRVLERREHTIDLE